MAEKQIPQKGQRTRGMLVRRTAFAPATGGAELAKALADDAREMLTSLGLASSQAVPVELQALKDLLRPGEPAILVFTDVPALPSLCLEGAIDSLRETDVVLGPCQDGGVYLVGWRAGLDYELFRAICDSLSKPAETQLASLTDVLSDAEAETELLPPWFRIANQQDLNVIECMARLSVLSETGEDDFAAEFLRQWFEQFAAE